MKEVCLFCYGSYPFTIGDLVDLLTAILLISGLVVIYQNKKQRHFQTIRECIKDYREIIRKEQHLNPLDLKESRILAMDHLGLINEELFYIKKGYLPSSIARTWIRNMIQYVPVFYGNKVINCDQIKENSLRILIEENEDDCTQILKGFDNIEQYFRVKYDGDIKIHEKKIVRDILQNIRPRYKKFLP